MSQDEINGNTTMPPPDIASDPISQPPPIFIFDSTRLRSHLFFRWLSTSSAVQPIYHPYLMAAMFGPDRIEQHHMHCSPSRRKELEVDLAPLYTDDTFPSSTTQFTHAVQSAQTQHKIPLANEHWFNVLTLPSVLTLLRNPSSTTHTSLPPNPTHLPSPLFHTLRPIILIRHPIPTLQSIYRTALANTQQRPTGADESFTLIALVRPLRVLFDFFLHRHRTQGTPPPLVVDGDDVLLRTAELGAALCAKLGLGELSEEWEPTSQEEIGRMNPLVYKITETVQLSTGIQRDGGGGGKEEPRLEEAVRRWTEEWGGEVAGQLAALVEGNMADWEYLRGFKI